MFSLHHKNVESLRLPFCVVFHQHLLYLACLRRDKMYFAAKGHTYKRKIANPISF